MGASNDPVRTGSVVMNQAVTIGPCAVAHGNLTVTVTSNPQVSQPNAMSNGQTVVTDRPDIQVKQDGGALMTVPAGTKLSDVKTVHSHIHALGQTRKVTRELGLKPVIASRAASPPLAAAQAAKASRSPITWASGTLLMTVLRISATLAILPGSPWRRNRSGAIAR